jgi:hypothetical protein
MHGGLPPLHPLLLLLMPSPTPYLSISLSAKRRPKLSPSPLPCCRRSSLMKCLHPFWHVNAYLNSKHCPQSSPSAAGGNGLAFGEPPIRVLCSPSAPSFLVTWCCVQASSRTEQPPTHSRRALSLVPNKKLSLHTGHSRVFPATSAAHGHTLQRLATSPLQP